MYSVQSSSAVQSSKESITFINRQCLSKVGAIVHTIVRTLDRHYIVPHYSQATEVCSKKKSNNNTMKKLHLKKQTTLHNVKPFRKNEHTEFGGIKTLRLDETLCNLKLAL